MRVPLVPTKPSIVRNDSHAGRIILGEKVSMRELLPLLALEGATAMSGRPKAPYLRERSSTNGAPKLINSVLSSRSHFGGTDECGWGKWIELIQHGFFGVAHDALGDKK